MLPDFQQADDGEDCRGIICDEPSFLIYQYIYIFKWIYICIHIDWFIYIWWCSFIYMYKHNTRFLTSWWQEKILEDSCYDEPSLLISICIRIYMYIYIYVADIIHIYTHIYRYIHMNLWWYLHYQISNKLIPENIAGDHCCDEPSKLIDIYINIHVCI